MRQGCFGGSWRCGSSTFVPGTAQSHTFGPGAFYIPANGSWPQERASSAWADVLRQTAIAPAGLAVPTSRAVCQRIDSPVQVRPELPRRRQPQVPGHADTIPQVGQGRDDSATVVLRRGASCSRQRGVRGLLHVHSHQQGMRDVPQSCSTIRGRKIGVVRRTSLLPAASAQLRFCGGRSCPSSCPCRRGNKICGEHIPGACRPPSAAVNCPAHAREPSNAPALSRLSSSEIHPPASAAGWCSIAGMAVGSHRRAATGRGPGLPPGAPRRAKRVTASRFCTSRAAACAAGKRGGGADVAPGACRAPPASLRRGLTAPCLPLTRVGGPALPASQLLPACAPAITCSRSTSGCSPWL